jgi:N-acetylmuramoyl-L-alanine amidase
MRVRALLLAVLVSALSVAALFPAEAAADFPHVVEPGETLTSVAAADNVSIAAIAAANGISAQSELVAGQTLEIPPQTAQNEVVPSTSAATSPSRTATADTATSTAGRAHVVLPGETLTSVAAANGVSIAAIAAANGISPRSELIAGQTLTIPSTGSSEQSATGSEPGDNETGEETAEGESSSSEVVNAAQSSTQTTTRSQASTTSSSGTAATGGPQPTVEHASAAEIAGIADANGVPAALAEAVAWQESGWNNDVVSNVGAVGVMQIIPNTWLWIDRYLTPGNPLGTAAASENIRAGVLLLHQLLGLTGGNEQLAVAGYYQGLASVKRNGMYADTQHYVADVMALTQRF